MNYEKKYKEALKSAKKLYEQGTITETLSYVFPELAEPEDEKIRKSIYIYLDWLDGRKEYTPRGEYTIRDMISWLEKQGESDETKAKIFLINKGYPIDANGRFPTYEEMYNIIREGLEKKELKKIEQKPAWNEEDEEIALGIEQVMNCASLLNIVPDKIDRIRTWLKSLKERIGG